MVVGVVHPSRTHGALSPIMKQFAEACRRNREPILEVLRDALPESGLVFEIGCGTGQHAAYFGEHLPGLDWQPSDVDPASESICAWRDDAGADNVRDPFAFNLFDDDAPIDEADAVVCINTIHIAPWEATRRLFEHAADLLPPGGPLFLYGPFRYDDRVLEASNKRFDRFLKSRDPESGIRCFDDIDEIADDVGFELADDVAMPANNRSIWWELNSEC